MLSADVVRTLVASAASAPSSHNTQPWLFRAKGDAIELLADRTRALPVNDPFDRELTISCGAALFSLRVAAAAHGLASRVDLLPDGPTADRLARVELIDAADDSDLAPLAEFLSTRRTYRKAFTDQPIGREAMAAIRAAIDHEGATLFTLDDNGKIEAGKLVGEGDRMQWDDVHWRRELAMWMHPRRQGDGLALPAMAVPIARLVTRSFDLGTNVGAKDQQLADASPWLTVLATEHDDAQSWLHAGQALQRALLVGCSLAMQASYLNQPVQVSALRPRLSALTSSAAFPQLLIRWGYPGEELPAAPRRSIDEILTFDAS